MKVGLIILWTVIGLIVGVFALGELGSLAGIPTMEGRVGFFALTFGAPVGTVAGFSLGLLLANRYVADLEKQKRIVAFTLLGMIGIVIGVVLFEKARTYDHLATRPNTYGLSFQVRLPAGAPTPAGEKVGIELRSAKESPKCDFYEYPHGLTRQGDNFVISGDCKIFFAVPQRTILVRIGAKPTMVFNVRVKARPESATYSEWFPVDEVYDNATAQKRPPRPDEMAEIRYGAR